MVAMEGEEGAYLYGTRWVFANGCTAIQRGGRRDNPSTARVLQSLGVFRHHQQSVSAAAIPEDQPGASEAELAYLSLSGSPESTTEEVQKCTLFAP
jgi:hypothetical protein